MALVNHLSPDLIALTGDFILNSIEYIDECMEAVGRLQAKEGLVAVLGNHDHRKEPTSLKKSSLIEVFQFSGIEILLWNVGGRIWI